MCKLLSQPWLVFVGKISYGLYLWHAPIFMLVFNSGLSRETGLVISMLATCGATLSSYYFLERPILRFKHTFSVIQ